MLALLYAATGLALGWLRPLWGLALLVGAVSVSGSLWWQLGWANTAAPLAYMLGFLLGQVARKASTGRSETEKTTARLPGGLLLAASSTVAFTLLATVLAVLREHAASGRILAAELAWSASSLFAFAPSSLAGELQAALTAMVGPLLLIAALVVLRGEAERTVMRRAFACGAVVATTAPILQFLLLSPWVRPDRGEYTSPGLVGFFQDPHSFAAYLVLIIGFAAGTSWGYARAGQRRTAIAYGLLGASALGVLVGTNSRTGMTAVALAIVCLVGIQRLERRHARGDDLAPALVVPVSLVAVALAVMLALTLSPRLRVGTYEGLRAIGARRLAQPLGPDTDWRVLLGDRQTRWAATLGVIEQRPLWGAGPLSIRVMPMGTSFVRDSGEIRVISAENTHNYFLQYAAEYGIPALLALLWLLGTMLASMWGNALSQPSAVTRGMVSGILAGAIGFMLFSTVSHPMLLPECQAIFWTLCALAISSTGNGSG